MKTNDPDTLILDYIVSLYKKPSCLLILKLNVDLYKLNIQNQDILITGKYTDQTNK